MVYNKPWGKTDSKRQEKYKKDVLKKIKSKLPPKKKKSAKKSAAKKQAEAIVEEKIAPVKDRKSWAEKRAEKFVTGKNYIVPTFGPMRCEGIQSVQISGFGEHKTLTFTNVFNQASGTLRIPIQKLDRYDIRSMASLQELKEMMDVLSSKKKIRARLPAQAGKRKIYFDDVLERGDLAEMAQLARKVYADFAKSTNGRQGIGTLDEYFLERALPAMAFQYAAGMNMDFDSVMSLIQRKAGKPSLAALSEPPRGRARAP